jgi:hypothetical protein
VRSSNKKENVFEWLNLRQEQQINERSSPLDILKAFEKIREKRQPLSCHASEKAFSKIVVAALNLDSIEKVFQLFQGSERAQAIAHMINADKLSLQSLTLDDEQKIQELPNKELIRQVLPFLNTVTYSFPITHRLEDGKRFEEMFIGSYKKAKYIDLNWFWQSEKPLSFPEDIEYLELGRSNITHIDLSRLKKLLHIKLDCLGCLKSVIFPESVTEIFIKQCSEIKRLSLGVLPHLRSLHVSLCDELLLIKSDKLRSLKTSDILHCRSLKKVLFNSVPSLRELSLTSNESLSRFVLSQGHTVLYSFNSTNCRFFGKDASVRLKD